jgi:hypothetical protein
MSIHIHIYDLATGVFTGVSLHTNLKKPADITAFIAANTPEGHGAYVGYVDPLSQRFDLATRTVVDYRPPQPSPRHEWNATSKRWQRPASINRSEVLKKIAELEAGQHRAVRETLIQACHAIDALKEALAPTSGPVREAVDRMYAAVARLEKIETDLEQMRQEL